MEHSKPEQEMSTDKTLGGILRINIDVTKIDKAALFKGKKGTYLDVSLLMHADEDEYGHHGMAVQDVGKERREAGERGEILGNCKWVNKPSPAVSWLNGATVPASQSPLPATVVEDDDMDEIPF